MPPNTLPPNVSRSLSISSEKSLGFQYPAKRYPLGSCPAFPGSFLLVQLPSQNRELDYIDYPLFSTVLCLPLNIFTLPSLERKGVGRGQRGRRAEEKKEGREGRRRREERNRLARPSVPPVSPSSPFIAAQLLKRASCSTRPSSPCFPPFSDPSHLAPSLSIAHTAPTRSADDSCLCFTPCPQGPPGSAHHCSHSLFNHFSLSFGDAWGPPASLASPLWSPLQTLHPPLAH